MCIFTPVSPSSPFRVPPSPPTRDPPLALHCRKSSQSYAYGSKPPVPLPRSSSMPRQQQQQRGGAPRPGVSRSGGAESVDSLGDRGGETGDIMDMIDGLSSSESPLPRSSSGRPYY